MLESSRNHFGQPDQSWKFNQLEINSFIVNELKNVTIELLQHPLNA